MTLPQATITRRALLRTAQLFAASAALPGCLYKAADDQFAPSASASHPALQPVVARSVMDRLSTYMAEAADRILPEPVLEAAKQHLLDTIAAMISGAALPPAKVAFSFVQAHRGASVATVVGSSLLCDPMEAALANGMLAHADETDDSHAPSHSHPGCAVVPAALAAAEQFDISGAHFLRAIVLGYDVGPRVLMALGGVDYQTSTHRDAHSIANTFAASAAAGCAASLNPRQMRWLLDLAAQQASGIAAWQRDTQHIEKSLVFAGMPARNGVTAALLVQLGATGVDDIFSGADNFLMASGSASDASQLTEKLGERYEITRTNIKKWSVGSPIQAPLDAISLILNQNTFSPDDVEKVSVRLAASDARTVDNRDMPDICLQHMIAVMLVDKSVSFAAAHDRPRMSDPVIVRTRAKIQLIPDEELERLHPRLVAIVEITLKDGAHLSQRVDAVRGTVANPMTRDEVIAKARDLMDGPLGPARSAQLVDAIFALDTCESLRSLRPLLQHQ